MDQNARAWACHCRTRAASSRASLALPVVAGFVSFARRRGLRELCPHLGRGCPRRSIFCLESFVRCVDGRHRRRAFEKNYLASEEKPSSITMTDDYWDFSFRDDGELGKPWTPCRFAIEYFLHLFFKEKIENNFETNSIFF